jgi:hypothetical protein
MPYVIHYFLSDDTVEVLEIHFSNEYNTRGIIVVAATPIPSC